MKIPLMRMREKLVVRVVSRFFIPFILLFGLYVQFHGDFGPGGGFQAGVIFTSGFVLYGLVLKIFSGWYRGPLSNRGHPWGCCSTDVLVSRRCF